jgi:dynactin complex subunit
MKKRAPIKLKLDKNFLAVRFVHCQAKCCMLCNNYLDNATAQQVIKNHHHAFERAIVKNLRAYARAHKIHLYLPESIK